MENVQDLALYLITVMIIHNFKVNDLIFLDLNITKTGKLRCHL